MEQTIIFGMLVIYKIVSLLVGLSFAYMGYRLFMADKTKNAGSLDASSGEHKISLKNAAPGIFFSLFGTVLIVFSVLKGISYSHETPHQEAASTAANRIIPDKPPF